MDLNTTLEVLSIGLNETIGGEPGGPSGPRGPGQLRFQDLVKVIRWIIFVVCSMGLFGNLLTFLASSKIVENGESSGTVFMKCLAVADNLACIRVLLNTCMPLFGLNLRGLNLPVCKTLAYYSGCTMIISNFCLAGLSFDRLLAVWVPVKYYQKSKPKYALGACIAVVVATCIFCIPMIFRFGLSPPRGLCDFDSSTLLAEIYVQSNILGFMFLIPIALVGGSSVAIVFKLKQTSKTSAAAANTSSRKKEREITLSLVLLAAFFTVNMLLGSISLILTTGRYVTDFSTEFLLKISKELPVALNNAMNFFLYFLASESFRIGVFATFGVKREPASSKKGKPAAK
ncbi:somatostatin receptor type 2-like [Convolutriloba macropyga]|uniref:somatostatin receptor type 2-like n=1 Tax=Convolutriloba macropyga TaxID=536237 RepID=UPI003F528E12